MKKEFKTTKDLIGSTLIVSKYHTFDIFTTIKDVIVSVKRHDNNRVFVETNNKNCSYLFDRESWSYFLKTGKVCQRGFTDSSYYDIV